MPTIRPRHLIRRHALMASLLVALTTGCATSSSASSPVTLESDTSAPPALELVPVVRYGRYNLVELVPESVQRDMMRQVVEVVVPPTLDANVGDALRHILLRSGYRLCDTADAATLYALPLPAAHLRLGPLMLRDALLTLAGPAWDLSVDDSARQVCFRRQATSVPGGVNSSATASVAPTPDNARSAEGQEVQP